jgi:thioredoxin-like negative regulator of GroEL
VLALAPDDKDAIRNVALQEADANHYSAALPLLERYIKEDPNDYKVNFAYAEILQHNQKKAAAKSFYDKALGQVTDIQDKTLESQLLEANLLYRSKGLTESEDLFRKLIEEHPDNKALRADFAEILLENKQYDEASVILSR